MAYESSPCLLDEGLISFAEAASSLPAIQGKRVSSACVWRWARKGLRGVRLEHRQIGARFLTSRPALDRFFASVAAVPLKSETKHERHPETQPKSQRERTAAQRRADVERARKELERDGI